MLCSSAISSNSLSSLLSIENQPLVARSAQGPSETVAGAEGFEPPLAVLETAGLPLNLRPYLVLNPSLLDLFMLVMLTAERAELLQRHTLRHRLLVLHGGVVLAL